MRVCVCVVVVQMTGCGCVWGGHALTVLQEIPCVLHGFLHIVQLRRVTVSVCAPSCCSPCTRAGGGAEGGAEGGVEVGEGQGEGRMWGGGEGQVQR